MKFIFLGLILFSFRVEAFLSTLSTEKIHQRLLEKYAPVWVHEIKSKPLYDILTRVDFDRNETGTDNLANASLYPLPAHAYGAVAAETSDSYYLFYGIYHVRDYDKPVREFFFKGASHDNDYEGAMLMVDKNTGGILAIETWYHNIFLQFAHSLEAAGNQTIDGKIHVEDETHPILYVQGMGHGIRAFQKLDEPRLERKRFQIYRLGNGTEDVKEFPERCLSYTLLPFDLFIHDVHGPFDGSSLFVNSYNFGIGPASLGKFISGPYKDDSSWARPKPPWSWFDKFDTLRAGAWFFHPAYVFNQHFSLHRSQHYTYNLGAQFILQVPYPELDAWAAKPDVSFYNRVPHGPFHRPIAKIRNFLYRITEWCFYYLG